MAFSSSVDFDAGDLEILEAAESLLLLKISVPEEKKRSVPQDRFFPWSFAKRERSVCTDGDAARPTKLAKLSPTTPISLSFSSFTSSSDENPLPPPSATLPPLPPRRKTMSDDEHAKAVEMLQQQQQQQLLPKRINGGRRTFPVGPNFSSESIRRSTEKRRSESPEIEWYGSCSKMQRLG